MNVLSRLIIPRMNLSIAYILSELEELEREDTFRLKRVKQKKMNKAKVDGAGEKIENIELNEEENTELEGTIEPDETAKPENTTEPEKTAKPDKTTKLVTESVLDSKVVQPKEAAEMGDLIVLKPPDDRLELGDAFLPPTGLKTMATITEVEELIEGISEIKKGIKNLKVLKEIQSDDKKIQLVDDDIKNDVENMETGEWFETPSKLENRAMLSEEISLYSKMEKSKDVISSVIEAETKSEAKMPLKADESIIDEDKRALTSLYKGIDSNFYQPTVDDIFSKHDLAMQDSVSQDISILDHSLVDLESIDFSIDSKGKVVVSKHDIVQSSPVISTPEADVSKLMSAASNDKSNQLLAPTDRIASVKWVNESKTEEEGLMSQFDGKPADHKVNPDDLEPTAEIIEEKSVKNITQYPKLKKLEDAEGSERTTETSAVEMPMSSDESIMDFDKRALASLYKGIDSNFYQPTVDDIFSKHEIPILDSCSKDIAILDHSLIDLDSIDFSIDSKGKVIISKHDSDQPSPLSTRESDVSKQMASYSKDGKLGSLTGRITSIKWEGESQIGEKLVSQMKNETDGKFADKNNELNNLEPTKEVIDEKTVENIKDTHKLQNGRETYTFADKTPLEADERIVDIDKRALASMYRDIDSNFYKPTVDDIFSKHDLAIQDSNSLQNVSMLDHSLVDLESIDFSLDSKGKVVVSKHSNKQASLLLTQEADVSKQRESNDNALKSTGQVSEKALDDVIDSNISENKEDTRGDDVIQINKHQDSFQNEILTIDLNTNDKKFEIKSNISLEENEVWTSNIEEIPKAPISRKLTTEPVKKELTHMSLRSKISRSISDENLSRISEEDYVEQDTSKLDTLVEELKEIKIKEINEIEGSVISDKFEDRETSFHDSAKLTENYKQQDDQKKDVEMTKKIIRAEPKVINETENLSSVQSHLKINDERFTQVQSIRSNSYTQNDKDINEMNNKSISNMIKSRKIYDSADTSKINQNHESVARRENVVNDFVKDNLKSNFEQSDPIETIESVNQTNLNSENEKNRSVTYPQYKNADSNKDNIQDTVRQGQILNESSIPESLPDYNVDSIRKENTGGMISTNSENKINSNNNETAEQSYKNKQSRKEDKSNHKPVRRSEESIKFEQENIRSGKNSYIKISEHPKIHRKSNTDDAELKETGREDKQHHEPLKVHSREILDSSSNIGNTKGEGQYFHEYKRISKDSQYKEGLQKELDADKIHENLFRLHSSNEIIKSEQNNEGVSKDSQSKEASSNKPLKIHSHELHESKRDGSSIENTNRYSLNYQDDKTISKDSEYKEGIHKELDNDKIYEKPFMLQSSIEIIRKKRDKERERKDSQSKEDSSESPLKIYSHEKIASKNDGQNFQEDKIISKDSQGKEDKQKELGTVKNHETLLLLETSSEIIKNEKDYIRDGKDGPSKEDGQSEEGRGIKEVSDSDGDQKGSQQSETQSRSSNIPISPERCNLCGTYHKKQD